jgi:hypothetical protein
MSPDRRVDKLANEIVVAARDGLRTRFRMSGRAPTLAVAEGRTFRCLVLTPADNAA